MTRRPLNGQEPSFADLLRQIIRFAEMHRSLTAHLLAEQQEATGPKAQAFTNDVAGGGGISDPTALSNRLAPFAHWAKVLAGASSGVWRALDQAERTYSKVISESGCEAPMVKPPDLCPGWNLELKSRLGGCGNQFEYYRTASGDQFPRSTMLCMSCRRASERHEGRVA